LAPSIALEDGARFKGSVEMDPQAVEKALGTSQAKAAARPDNSPNRPNGDSKPAEAKPAGTAPGPTGTANAGR
jgi:hypothetical protein